ncbi:McrC family protein [Chitinophaga filiformis]|uniref:Restriction endonuclease n=1 Tax=Chitinophaga filiformis TaxID=104663 RepID=A0ABY4I8F3_CHIFI|nr:restriction endonuclease [Chitinophaga filiformis]UPK70966.1 restriction endonuclease [Chitinophaga filiformis]
MYILFEYGDHISVTDRIGLEIYLHSLWQNHKELWKDQMPEADDLPKREFQPFISFDGVRAKANNFVGFIHYGNELLEIYPKVFRQMLNPNKELMHQHLFYWFSYCKKIKFPFNQSFLNNFDSDYFPELIIYLIANQINEVVNTKPYSAYEEVEEALLMPRGKINFGRYTRNLAFGKSQYIDCDYEPFVYDNKVNRVIKYCVRLLLSKTVVPETQRILNGTINVLDEVEDQVCSITQLNQIKIPTLFVDYEDVMHSCRMIIENQVYSYVEYEMKNWSVLFPMEYIFEDFISGFLKKHFNQEFDIESQKSELYLHQDPQTFNLQHDILLTNRKTKEKIIIDTKYKPRWGLSVSDKKKGVSQSDMYQMISYAYRRGTDKVILLYPNTSDKLAEDYMFTVQKSKENEHIKIKVVDIPFWSSTDHKEVESKLLTKLGSVLLSGF